MEFIRKNRNRIYVAIAAAAIALALILGSDYMANREPAPEPAETVTTRTEKEKKDKVLISVSTETIREGLANMGVLITQEYYFTQLETYTKEKKIFSFIPTSSEFMYSYDGSVLAGVDFAGIEIGINEDTRTITVDIPASEIQAVTIDKGTFKIYSEKDSLWNPLKLEDYNISLAEFEEAARQKALSSGVLERADEQAASLVREFITSLPNTAGYKVEIE